MLDKLNSLYSKYVLNDANYHKLIAISMLLLILAFVLLFIALEPTKPSEEFLKFKARAIEE